MKIEHKKMTFQERLKGLGIAFVILILCMPLAALFTFLMLPIWRWLEATFAIESIGHSGPAEWCYLASYIVLVMIATWVWSLLLRSH